MYKWGLEFESSDICSHAGREYFDKVQNCGSLGPREPPFVWFKLVRRLKKQTDGCKVWAHSFFWIYANMPKCIKIRTKFERWFLYMYRIQMHYWPVCPSIRSSVLSRVLFNHRMDLNRVEPLSFNHTPEYPPHLAASPTGSSLEACCFDSCLGLRLLLKLEVTQKVIYLSQVQSFNM